MAASIDPKTVRWDEAPSIDPASVQWDGEPEAQPRTPWQGLLRQVGLTARHALTGTGNLIGVITDPIASSINLGTIAAGGSPVVPNARTTFTGLADRIGLPTPETGLERAVATGAESMVPAAGMAGVAGRIAPMATGATKAIATRLAVAPATQAASAGVAGLASGGVREGGGGPFAQAGAGLAAGVITSLLGEVIRGLPRTAAAAAAPFHEGGRERIVGDVIRRQASDPVQALRNLRRWRPHIPGSQPTAPQAARDDGLLIAERGMPAPYGARAADLATRNNAARSALLDALGADEAAVVAAKGARDSAAAPIYAQAHERTIVADATLRELLKRPAMRSAIARAQKLAENAGERLVVGRDVPAEQANAGIVDAAGRVVTREVPEQAAQYTGRGLHYVKMALDDMIDDPSPGIGGNERAAIIGIKRQFLDWLDRAIPEYGQARQGYTEASRPINQMELIQRIRQGASSSNPDVAGNPVLSPAKWARLVNTRLRPEIRRTLTPAQQAQIAAITEDLDRAALTSSAGRAAGSNTFQNLSTAHVISRALQGHGTNDPFLASLMRPLQWLYRIPEQQAQDLLVDAMLDPTLAARLLGKASPQAVDAASDALRQRLSGTVLGSTVGTATAVQEPSAGLR